MTLCYKILYLWNSLPKYKPKHKSQIITYLQFLELQWFHSNLLTKFMSKVPCLPNSDLQSNLFFKKHFLKHIYTYQFYYSILSSKLQPLSKLHHTYGFPLSSYSTFFEFGYLSSFSSSPSVFKLTASSSLFKASANYFILFSSASLFSMLFISYPYS